MKKFQSLRLRTISTPGLSSLGPLPKGAKIFTGFEGEVVCLCNLVQVINSDESDVSKFLEVAENDDYHWSNDIVSA